MASTIKVDTVTTPDGTGNITFNRPIVGDGSNLTNLPSDITKSAAEPAADTNPSGGVGSIWLNTTSGEMYSCTDATVGANVWTNIGDGSGFQPNPYITATGGIITTDGDYKVHTFSNSGTFTPAIGDAGVGDFVEYLVIAAGASGGGRDGTGSGGGGGAGGYLTATNFAVTSTGLTVTVGAGGAAVTSGFGTNGEDSVFSTITATGGGGGGYYNGYTGKTGGSGGGGGHNGAGGARTASPVQGNNGGTAAASGGGGGGGAGAVGGSRDGGAGTSSSITGLAVVRGGGGGGAGQNSITPGVGGTGGGGAGATGTSVISGVSGTANTGSGGGGTSESTGTSGSGGSGIVIVRYQFQ